jgi:hypothetical protein
MLFFGPLAKFPLHQAYYIWHLCNAAFTFSLIMALYFAGICRSISALAAAALLLVLSYPWIIVMTNGQPMIVMALGLLGGQLLVRNKHYWLAAIILVLTAFKPPLVIAPIVYLLIISGKHLWSRMIVVGLAVIAICAAVFGVSIWQDYLEILIKTPDIIGVEYAVMSMANLRTLALLFWGSEHVAMINIISSLLWVCMGVATIALAYGLRHKNRAMQDLGFGAVIALSCVFSPYLYVNALLLLVIPMGYVIKYAGKEVQYALILSFVLVNYCSTMLVPESNAFLWVPAQLALISMIVYYMRRSFFLKHH